MSKIVSFSRPARVEAAFQSRMVLLKCGPGIIKPDCGDEKAKTEPASQQNQSANVECEAKSKKLRTDRFGSEGSSSEDSFDDELFDDPFETASLNSQLSALEDLEELEIDNSDQCGEKIGKESDIVEQLAPVSDTHNALLTGASFERQELNKTNVHVGLKTEDKDVNNKASKIRCRVPSREEALGTTNNTCSESTNSLASEAGSESSTTFQGPGDKSHEVKVQRVSLASLPGLGMPDFIRASMEASLEKMTLQNEGKEAGDEKSCAEKKETVTDKQPVIESQMSSQETGKNPTPIRATIRPRKKPPPVCRRGSKPQDAGGETIAAEQQQSRKSSQSSKTKSPGGRTRRKEPEVRPRGSKPRKTSVENIKITQSEIVMVVTNDQKSTSPRTKIPVLRSDVHQTPPSPQAQATVSLRTSSTSESEPEASHVSSQPHPTQESAEAWTLLKQDEDTDKESALQSPMAAVTSPRERGKSNIPISPTFAVACKREEDINVESSATGPSTDERTNERKSKIPLPLRQQSLESQTTPDGKFADERADIERPTNTAATVSTPTVTEEVQSPLPRVENRTMEGEAKLSLTSERLSEIALPSTDQSPETKVSLNQEIGEELTYDHSSATITSPTERTSKIPVPLKLEAQRSLDKGDLHTEELPKPVCDVNERPSESTEASAESLILEKSPIKITSPKEKSSKIPMPLKLPQSEYQTSSTVDIPCTKERGATLESSITLATSPTERKSKIPRPPLNKQPFNSSSALSSTTPTFAPDDDKNNVQESMEGELVHITSAPDKGKRGIVSPTKSKIPLSPNNEELPRPQSSPGDREEGPLNSECNVIQPETTVASPREKKSKIPQSKIPLPGSSLPTSPVDKKEIWMDNKRTNETDGTEVGGHTISTTSSQDKTSKLPVATSRLPVRKDETEAIEDGYDSGTDDGVPTLMQRYMMCEDLRVEEIIRQQKFPT